MISNPSPFLNSPGSFNCMCNVGFDLFTADGTSEMFIPGSETGDRDGDTLRLNKTCVPKMCPQIPAPENGQLLAAKNTYRYDY